MDSKFEDRRTLRHLRESYKNNKVYNNEEKFRDYKNILLLYFHKYSDELKLNNVIFPKLIQPYNWVEYSNIIINNI